MGLFPRKRHYYLLMAPPVECLIMVALLWGVTNPFIKLGSKGLEKLKKQRDYRVASWWGRLGLEVKYLGTEWRYLLPLLLNLLGSALFFTNLASTSMEKGDDDDISTILN